MSKRWILAAILFFFPAAFEPLFAWSPPQYVRDILNKAKADVVKIPLQADVLAGFAWPRSGTGDPLVMAAARQELVGFGHNGLMAVRNVIRTGPPQFQADAVAVLVQAQRAEGSRMPPDYMPGLDEAMWFGSIEAQRLGMQELARYKFPPAVLKIIDAVDAHPELASCAIMALGRMGDDRAQYFLADVLRHGPDRYRLLAAQALAILGGNVVNTLRAEARSGVTSTRQAAVLGLLPAAGVDDLTLLYEYITQYPDDDTVVLERARARAIDLEEQFQKQQQEESASAPKGDGE